MAAVVYFHKRVNAVLDLQSIDAFDINGSFQEKCGSKKDKERSKEKNKGDDHILRKILIIMVLLYIIHISYNKEEDKYYQYNPPFSKVSRGKFPHQFNNRDKRSNQYNCPCNIEVVNEKIGYSIHGFP